MHTTRPSHYNQPVIDYKYASLVTKLVTKLVMLQCRGGNMARNCGAASRYPFHLKVLLAYTQYQYSTPTVIPNTGRATPHGPHGTSSDEYATRRALRAADASSRTRRVGCPPAHTVCRSLRAGSQVHAVGEAHDRSLLLRTLRAHMTLRPSSRSTVGGCGGGSEFPSVQTKA